MDDLKKRIIMVCLLFFIITGTILFLVHLLMTEYNLPDPPNYVTIVIEIVVGVFIAVLVYMITRKQQSDSEKREKTRVLEEHQHYKERLLSELHTFIFRVDTAMIQFIKKEQKLHMFENINLAKINLHSLYQINSIFAIPSQIKSQCDDLLSFYNAIMNLIEREHMIGEGIETRMTLAKDTEKLLEHEFFAKNNTKNLDEQLTKVKKQLSHNLSKNK